jgi:predicted metal-binding membrane protein
MRFGTAVTRPWGALRMGSTHGLYCLGCCWALMAVLVALGTMNLAWMLALATLILLEKNAPAGHRIAQAAAAAFVAIGLLLIVHPETITTLT